MKEQTKRTLLLLTSTAIALCALFILLLAPVLKVSADAAVWDGTTVATQFAGGEGSEENPWQIATAEQFMFFASVSSGRFTADCYVNEYIVLTADINLGGHEIIPMGCNGTEGANAFRGVFDGAGHTVSDVNVRGVCINILTKYNTDSYFNGTDYIFAGLFAAVGEGGVIRNLSVTGNIGRAIDYPYPLYAGGIAAYVNGGTIENCLFTGEINITDYDGEHDKYIGGVAGYATGTNIKACVTSPEINVTGNYAASTLHQGGIYGSAADGSNDDENYSDYCTAENGGNSGYAITANGSATVAGWLNGWIQNQDTSGLYTPWYKSFSYDYPTFKDVAGEVETALSALGGSGTELSPYIIDSADDLRLLSKAVNFGYDTRGLYFKQTADISFGIWNNDNGNIENEEDFTVYTATNFTPIGISEYSSVKRYTRDTYYRLWNKDTFASIFDTYDPANVYLECRIDINGKLFCGFVDEYMTKYNLTTVTALADNFENNVIEPYYTIDFNNPDENPWESTYQSGMILDAYENRSFFSGIYDGNNKQITGLFQAESGTCGVFGETLGAQIKNLKVCNSKLSGYNGTAAIVGYAEHRTTVSNCSTDYVSVYSTYNAGAIVGYARNNITVTGCYADRNTCVYAESGNAGGIVGLYDGDNGIIENCIINASVGLGTYATGSGGIVGATERNQFYFIGRLKIISCQDRGLIGSLGYGRGYVGGVIGYADRVDIIRCTHTGVVETAGDWGGCGGIVGYGRNTDIRFCASTGAVFSSGAAGAILGTDDELDRCTVISCRYVNGMSVVGDTNEGAQPAGNYGYPSGGISDAGLPSFPDVWDGDVATEYNGGEGSAENPYQIANGEQLARLAAVVNGGTECIGKYFILTADIDLGDLYWTPIGNGEFSFKGILDGAGHTISGLYVYKRCVGFNNPVVGFFGSIQSSEYTPVVRNLIIEGQVYGISENANAVYAGGFVGAAWGAMKIYNCAFIGSVNAEYYDVEGNGYSHPNCYASAFAGYSGTGLEMECVFADISITTVGNNPQTMNTFLGYGYHTLSGGYYISDINGTTAKNITDGETEAAAINEAQKNLPADITYSEWYGDSDGLSFTKRTVSVTERLSALGGDGTMWDPYIIDSSDDLRLLSELVNSGEHLTGMYFLQTADISFGEWVDDNGNGFVDDGEIKDGDGKAFIYSNFTPIGEKIDEESISNSDTGWAITSREALAALIAEKGVENIRAYIRGVNIIDDYLSDVMMFNELETNEELIDYLDNFIKTNISTKYAEINAVCTITFTYPVGNWFSGIYQIDFNWDEDRSYTISGLYIKSASDENGVGLFGAVRGTNIEGICIKDSYISSVYYAGAVAGYADNVTFINCITENIGISAAGEYAYAGGIVGCAYNCGVSCCTAYNISLSGSGGGIAGYAEETNISDCYADITADTPDGYYIGGIAGECDYGSIDKCSASGIINGDEYIGGIVGYLYNAAVSDSFVIDMTITGNGGFHTYEYTDNGGVSHSYSWESGVGGIVGTADGSEEYPSSVTGCFVCSATVTGNAGYSGYICGFIENTVTVSGCYYEAAAETDSLEGTTFKTAAKFASGEVAWLLNTNGGTAANNGIWSQDAGYPFFSDGDLYGAIYRVKITGAVEKAFYIKCKDIFTMPENIHCISYADSVSVLNDMSYTADMALTGAQPMLGASITISYSADILTALVSGAPRMIFTYHEKTYTADGVAGTVNGDYTLYTFDFTGISPQCMGDLINSSLTVGDKTVTKSGYSMKAYCIAMLGKAESEVTLPSTATFDEFQTLLRDILVYGGASQIYTDYNRGENDENLVSNGITGTVFPTEGVTATDRAVTFENGNTDSYFVSFGLWFDNVNRIYWKYQTSDNSVFSVRVYKGETKLDYVTISAVQGEDNTYVFYSDDIPATGFNTVYRAELYKDGVLVQTAKYSVNSYVQKKQNEKNEQNQLSAAGILARALYNYGIATENYTE